MGYSQIQTHQVSLSYIQWLSSKCSINSFLRTLQSAHDWGVMGLQYEPSSGTLVSCALDGVVKIWDLETSKVINTLRGHTQGIYCCKWKDNLIASGSVDETIRVWDKRDGSCVGILRGHNDEVDETNS